MAFADASGGLSLSQVQALLSSYATTQALAAKADASALAAKADASALAGYLPLTGGSLSGDLDLGSHNLLTSGLVDGKDVSALGVVTNTLYDLTSVAAGGFTTAPPAPWAELRSGGTGNPVSSTHTYGASGLVLAVNDATYRVTTAGLLAPGVQRPIYNRNVTLEVVFGAFGKGKFGSVSEYGRVYAGFFAEGADGYVMGASMLKITGSGSNTWFGGKAIKNQGSGGLTLGDVSFDATGVSSFKLKCVLSSTGVQGYYALGAGNYVEQVNSGGQTGAHDFRYADTVASPFNSSGSGLHAFVCWDAYGTAGGAKSFVRVDSITFSAVS